MIAVIEDEVNFWRLKEEWNELLEASKANCLFLTWEWLYTWWKHLSEGRRLSIITVRSGTELVAIAPLALRPPRVTRLSPFSSLEFLGMGTVGSDYLDLIIRRGKEREALQALAGYLADRNLALELGQLRRGASFAAEIASQLMQQGWRLSAAKTNVCPFINLSGHSWESYLATLGTAHRYNFKRRLKNLAKEFDVRFEQVGAEEQRREALALLVALHNTRWKERGKLGAFYTPGLLSFHEEISSLALAHGWLRLFTLWLERKPVASIYGFRYGNVFSFYQSGFDLRYQKQSVGLVAMGLAIKSAIEEGAAEYDLLHGDEPYKFQWARDVRELERLGLYPPSTFGLVHKQALGLNRASKRIARRVIGNHLADRIVGGGLIGFWKGS